MIVPLGYYCLIPLFGLVAYMAVQCGGLICFQLPEGWSLIAWASLVPFIMVLCAPYWGLVGFAER